MQLALEEKFMRMAETLNVPTIIVCDRGTMDISAYMKPEMWQEITLKMNTSSETLRQRYDAVLHLVSAADGAEQFYTTANNSERTGVWSWLENWIRKLFRHGWDTHTYG